jgi:hypothetical protein
MDCGKRRTWECGVTTNSKRLSGRPSFNWSIPEPEEVKEVRLKANLSQREACNLSGIKEVMTWSNCETRRADGTPKARMDPIRWEYFLLIVGQHSKFVILPRLGVEQPREAAALTRKGPSLPGENITFAVESRTSEDEWRLVEGGQFTALTAACVAIDTMVACRNLNELRVSRYSGGDFVMAVHGPGVSMDEGPKRFTHAKAAPSRRTGTDRNGADPGDPDNDGNGSRNSNGFDPQD